MNEVTPGSYWKELENRVEELAEELVKVTKELDFAKEQLAEYEKNAHFNHDGDGTNHG